MSDLIHKRRADWAGLSGPTSRCGRYGYVHREWSRVNCDACLKKRKGKP